MISLISKRRTPKLLCILLLALLLRFVFVYPQFSGDVKNHIVWGQSVLDQGTSGLYERHFPGFNDVNYPPVTISLFAASRWLYQATNSLIFWQNFHAKFLPSFLVPLWMTQNMEAAFMKLPGILADVGVGYLLCLILRKKNNKHPLFWASLYFFNPAVIYVSAVWGQIESLPVFFLLLSLYLLPSRYYLSFVAFVIAALTKQTALWLTPVFLVIWYKEGGVKIIAGFLLQVVTFVLLYLPFSAPLASFSSYLATLAGSSNHITDQAFNLWYFFYGWANKPDSLPLLGLSVRVWSIILLIFAYLLLTYLFFKKYSLKMAGTYLFLLSLAAFFLQTRVHDRHLAPALPFLLLVPMKPKPLLVTFVLLTLYHLINLYLALRLPFI